MAEIIIGHMIGRQSENANISKLSCRNIIIVRVSRFDFWLFTQELIIYSVLARIAFNLEVLPPSAGQQSSSTTFLYALLP